MPIGEVRHALTRLGEGTFSLSHSSKLVTTGNPCSEITINKLEHNTMSNTNTSDNAVNPRTYIGNTNAADMTLDALLAVIKHEEGDIASLSALTAKSKKVKAIIKEKQDNILKIVELIDAD